ncbi:hypothetical protein MMC29_000852 [Sticta canariensis]|nr:hypothetical protein [Sticta canariensis]
MSDRKLQWNTGFGLPETVKNAPELSDICYVAELNPQQNAFCPGALLQLWLVGNLTGPAQPCLLRSVPDSASQPQILHCMRPLLETWTIGKGSGGCLANSRAQLKRVLLAALLGTHREASDDLSSPALYGKNFIAVPEEQHVLPLNAHFLAHSCSPGNRWARALLNSDKCTQTAVKLRHL